MTGKTSHDRTGTPLATQPPRENFKETLESVVVAFILAFVFRAFIIEAFVIPTGSMASTLNGEHWTHTCSDCGHQFDVGANRSHSGSRNNTSPVRCPNCDWTGDEIELSAHTENGDRILVFKWPLDFIPLARTLFEPQRWDVTVFKDPADGTTNFIKRLVGLPGEVLEIVDGDIYTVPLEKLPDPILQKLRQLRELKIRLSHAPDSRQAGPHRHQAYAKMARELSMALTPHQRIQRKSAQAKNALRFIVFDADHPSRHAESGSRHQPAPYWAPAPNASAWRTGERRLQFDGLNTPRQLVRLDGINLTDAYGYNSALRPAMARASSMVGDLSLQVVLTPQDWPVQNDRSFFELILTKRGEEFRARLEPDGLVSLLRAPHNRNAPPEVLCSAQAEPLRIGEARRFAIANTDYRITVSIDDKEVLVTTDQMYSPDLARLKRAASQNDLNAAPLAHVALAAANLRAQVAHVLLQRDVYYRRATLLEGRDQNVWFNHPGWATLGNPILLGPSEYFMLGDNSPQSKDSRLWWQIGRHLKNNPDYQLGTVPGNQIIGRAFFVYWPGGYRAWWTLGRAVIPNVGRMRWIQ